MPFMLPVILKNLFTGVATRLYPATPRKLPEDVRGHISFDQPECIFCGSCSRKCPAKAIEVDLKKELRFYLDRCIMCIVCVEVCPKKCIHYESQWSKPFYEKSVLSFSKKEEPKQENKIEEPAKPQVKESAQTAKEEPETESKPVEEQHDTASEKKES